MQGAGGGGGGGGGCAAPLCESDGGIRLAAKADVKFCLSAAAAAAADDDDVPFTNASAKSIHVGDAVIPPITPPPPLPPTPPYCGLECGGCEAEEDGEMTPL